jgi:hypothetical protein
VVLECGGVLEASLAKLAQVGPHLGVHSYNVAQQTGGFKELFCALIALM